MQQTTSKRKFQAEILQDTNLLELIFGLGAGAFGFGSNAIGDTICGLFLPPSRAFASRCHSFTASFRISLRSRRMPSWSAAVVLRLSRATAVLSAVLKSPSAMGGECWCCCGFGVCPGCCVVAAPHVDFLLLGYDFTFRKRKEPNGLVFSRH